VTFFEKLQARESAKKRMSSLFASHPPTEDRVIANKMTIEHNLPPREQYLVSTSEFDRVKARLAMMQDQRTPSEKDRAPSLIRRRPSSRPGEDSTDKEEAKTKPEDREPDPDAPPVLRRPQDRPQ
jgi:predicted Zn-dependent protease